MNDATGIIASRYPKLVTLGGSRVFDGRVMTADDVEGVLAFARGLDPDDLLFLRVNITERRVVERWAHLIETGRTHTVLALEGGTVVGEATLLHNTPTWTRHIGEIRMQVAPAARGCGLARVLADETEWIARQLQLKLLTARMTLDQAAAQAVFRQLGFQREAVLWDYVMTADGKTHDLLVATKRL